MKLIWEQLHSHLQNKEELQQHVPSQLQAPCMPVG